MAFLRGVVPVGLLLWTVTAWIVSVTRAEDAVSAARCKVRCLTELQRTHSPMSGSRIKQSTSLFSCQTEAGCSWCLRPCDQSFVTLAKCVEQCPEEGGSCMESCRYLKQMRTIRPGSCPLPKDAAGFAAACVESCTSDNNCEDGLKCCSNGCGYTCQRPLYHKHSFPPPPGVPSIRERKDSLSVELDWKSVVTNTSGPIIYIVQSKWNIGKHHSAHHMTDWRAVHQTSRSSAVLRDTVVSPGRWYQFRLQAVNINGSGEYSDATKPFKLSREPNPPTPPRNFTEGDTTIQNGQIGVRLHWQPPARFDLPVTRYKVYWSRRLRKVSAQFVSLREHKKSVPASQMYYDLENLVSDTTYFVQVQGISQYGDTRLKSNRASMYITTFKLPQATMQATPGHESSVKAVPTPGPVHNVTVHKAFYHNGLLKTMVSWAMPEETQEKVNKFLIYWTPDVCLGGATKDDELTKTMSATTHENQFDIYDLRFDCRYVVKVQPVSKRGRMGPVTHVTSQTPSCDDVVVKGDIKPDCPINVPNVPEAPVTLQHTFIIKKDNITARIKWTSPHSDASLVGYRILWGQAIDDPHHTHYPILDRNTALTKVVPKDTKTFIAVTLREATTYVVQVQALSGAGVGRPAVIHFTTPTVGNSRKGSSSKNDPVPVGLPATTSPKPGTSKTDNNSSSSHQISAASAVTLCVLQMWQIIAFFTSSYAVTHTAS